MSKFFAKGDSSESESEESETSSEESSSEEEKPVKKQAARTEQPVRRGPRKVVSQKDKRFDEMRQTVKQLKNAIKINDWNAISNDFQKINQQIAKAGQLIQQDGIPRFYIKICVQLADVIENTSKDKEKVKKMSKTNAKSLNAMKQNIKKNNSQYEEEIKKYNEAPDEDSGSDKEEESESGSDESADSESSESDSDESEKEDKKPAKKPVKPAKADDESDDDDDEDWPSDSSSSSSSEEELGNQPRGISKWLKKPGADSDDDDGFEKVKKDKKEQQQQKKNLPRKVKDEDVKVKEETKQLVLTEENVRKQMNEIQGMRGKKGTSKRDQIAQLEVLATAKISPSMTAQVLVHLISAQFDSSMQRGVPYMPVSFDVEGTPSRDNCLWTRCMVNIRRLLHVLKENPELTEEATGQQAAGSGAGPDAADFEEEEGIQVTSNLVSFVERLDDELYLSLRLLDNHSPDFIKRLLDIAPFLELAELVQDYYAGSGQAGVAARLAMRRLEHVYYKHNALVAKAAGVAAQRGDRATNRDAFVAELATWVYRHGDDGLRTRAMLCHMYHHALHDRFLAARDMLLMSHLQDSIHQSHSIQAQVLFNRTMAQLGLSAFRNGLVAEAHACLDELCANNKLKELLAQGLVVQRYGAEKTPEQERAERRRQTPYHMHLNLDLVECVHLVSAVLLEVPRMVAVSFDGAARRGRTANKALKRVMDMYDRNPLAGPPEGNRDVIIAGARALERGDWRQCEAYILGLPVWQHLWSEDGATRTRKMLEAKIREEALRTFLFAYGACYDALSLAQLAHMFELEAPVVASLVSRMMMQDEVAASWDQPTGCVVMQRKERSKLHHLAHQLSDLVGKLVEANDKAWEGRFGESRFAYRDAPRAAAPATSGPAPAAAGWGGGNQRGGGAGYARGGQGASGAARPASSRPEPGRADGPWRPSH